MAYQFIGKIIKVSVVIPVNGKVKEKCTFIVRDDSDGSREIAFILFDENIYSYLQPLEVGDKVKVTFTIKSREYQGSYTTSCFATNVEKIEEGKGEDEKKKSHRTGGNRSNSYNSYSYNSDNDKQRFWEEFAKKEKQKSSTNDYFTGIKSKDEAKKKYRDLCKEFHPDKPGGSTEKMQEINLQFERWK